DVYSSWRDFERTNSKVINFDKLWNNSTSKLHIIDFPEAAKNKLIKYKPKSIPLSEPSIEIYHPSAPKILEEMKIRDYQREAINSWFMKNGKGILKMATGTGKTFTSLYAMT